MGAAELSDELFDLLRDLHERSPVVTTVANGRPNRIVAVDRDAVLIETEASRRKGTGPQPVPAWMIETAWSHLRTMGALTGAFLVSSEGLNVKRSSAVCALLARLPGVEIASSRPIDLRYRAP